MGISPRQFEQMRERLAGKRPGAKAETARLAEVATHQIILGVDPSLRGTGYGVIRLEKPNPVALAHGTISVPSTWEHSRCLVKIYQTLRDVIAEHRPTACVLEGLFFAQNLQTALIMGEARGASMLAAGEAGLEVFEISPRAMKRAIAGHGAAEKSAVAKMAQRLLHLADLPAPDAADALGLALAFAQESGRFSLRPPKRV